MELLAALGWLVAIALGGVAWNLRGRLLQADAERRAMVDRTREALVDAEASVRRVRDEAERARPFAAEPVLRDLLTIIDDLDRAIAAGEGGAGVAMIQRQSVDLLRRHGAERLTCVEQPFDPSTHEAVATAPSAGPANRVVAELSAGYRLHGRLLRPARVVVAIEAPGARPAEPPDAPEAGRAREPSEPPQEARPSEPAAQPEAREPGGPAAASQPEGQADNPPVEGLERG
jgi:molecular chaperone GrpE